MGIVLAEGLWKIDLMVLDGADGMFLRRFCTTVELVVVCIRGKAERECSEEREDGAFCV